MRREAGLELQGQEQDAAQPASLPVSFPVLFPVAVRFQCVVRCQRLQARHSALLRLTRVSSCRPSMRGKSWLALLQALHSLPLECDREAMAIVVLLLMLQLRRLCRRVLQVE